MEHYSAIKKNKLLIEANIWMVNKRSHRQKITYGMMTLL